MLVALSTPPKPDTDDEEREPTPEERQMLRDRAMSALLALGGRKS